jgi:hypothetical protein
MRQRRQVFQTRTAGAEWHEITGALANLDVFAVMVNPQESNTVYAVVRGNSVYVAYNVLGRQ